MDWRDNIPTVRGYPIKLNKKDKNAIQLTQAHETISELEKQVKHLERTITKKNYAIHEAKKEETDFRRFTSTKFGSFIFGMYRVMRKKSE